MSFIKGGNKKTHLAVGLYFIFYSHRMIYTRQESSAFKSVYGGTPSHKFGVNLMSICKYVKRIFVLSSRISTRRRYASASYPYLTITSTRRLRGSSTPSGVGTRGFALPWLVTSMFLRSIPLAARASTTDSARLRESASLT